jgi:DNA mismatch repair protein PMS2
MSATAVQENDHFNDSGLIVPMDNGSIQRIVAGQAVTDLASAIKELVDNALDAGAKTINSE